MSDPEEDRDSEDSDNIPGEGLGKLEAPSLSQSCPYETHVCAVSLYHIKETSQEITELVSVNLMVGVWVC
jgi:hypothetical protein